MDVSETKATETATQEPWDLPLATAASGGGRLQFHERLDQLIRQSGRSISGLARASGVRRTTLLSWAGGVRHPRLKSLHDVEAIERTLGAARGTLTALVSRWPGRLETRLTDYGRHLARRLGEHYLHRFRDWEPKARDEWTTLYDLKTASPLSADDPADDQTYWFEDNDSCATAQRCLVDTECYYGWLIHHAGMRPRDMSLALFTDMELLEAYVEFRRERSFGRCISEQIPQILRLVGMLTRPKTGLLWREPGRFANHRRLRGGLPTHCETASGARVRLWRSSTRWREHCERVRRRVALQRRKLRRMKVVRPSRTGDNIRAILDAPRPWAILHLCERRMLSDAIPPTCAPLRRAIREQQRLIVRFLIRYAFRRATICRILLQDIDLSDGRMRLPRERFKNRRFIDEPWVTTLPASLLADVRAFAAEHRPVLLGDRRGSTLFVPSGEDAARNMLQIVADACARMTQRYLPEWTTGIRPHAVRDIVATSIIKADPIHGFQQAAIALWDREETIRTRYAHLETIPFQAHHERLADEAGAAAPSVPVGILSVGILDKAAIAAPIAAATSHGPNGARPRGFPRPASRAGLAA